MDATWSNPGLPGLAGFQPGLAGFQPNFWFDFDLILYVAEQSPCNDGSCSDGQRCILTNNGYNHYCQSGKNFMHGRIFADGIVYILFY